MGYDAKIEHTVAKELLRYVVPFNYHLTGGVQSYDEVIKQLEASKEWSQIKEPKEETDCYDYIRAQYDMIAAEGNNNHGVGSVWQYNVWTNEQKTNGQPFFAIRCKLDSGEYVYATIKSSGLYLVKDSVGLFWYELQFIDVTGKNVSYDVHLPVEDLMEFQNSIKELSWRQGGRDYDCVWVQTYSRLLSEDFVEDVEGRRLIYSTFKSEDKEGKKNKKEEKDKPQEVISVTRPLCSDGDDFTLEYNTIKESTLFQDVRLEEVQNYPLGYKIYKVLEFLNPTFFSNRECSGYSGFRIPDKPVLYNYVVVREDQKLQKKDTLEAMAFYLTHGYKRSYLPDSNVNERMLYPFDNILWYCEKEGCGIYAISDSSNEAFLLDNMIKRVERDYFLLFMNLLQQSYVALTLAEEIAFKVSSNKEDILQSDTELTKVLQDLETRINLFVVKNVYASVSHVGHHNLFYEYGERQLRIKEDIDTLRDGLDALDEIHRRCEEEERDREKDEKRKREQKDADKMKNAFAILTIISVLSLPENLHDAILFLVDNGSGELVWLAPWVKWTLVIVSVIILGLVLLSSWPSLKKLFRYIKEDVFTSKRKKN